MSIRPIFPSNRRKITVDAVATVNFEKIEQAYNAGKKGICLEGSSRSGKTFAACQFWISTLAQKKGRTLTIGRDWRVTLKDTVWVDLLEVLDSFKIRHKINKSDLSVEFGGNLIRCVGILDNIQKFHGLKQDYFFINEAITLPQAVYNQIKQRTGSIGRDSFFILDYNPSEERHWVYNLPLDPTIAFYKSTYKGNPFLSPDIVRQLESYDPANPLNVERGTANLFMYKVYALGQRGADDAVIFRNWDIAEAWPEQFDDERFGLDFGYTHDPAAMVHVRFVGNSVYLKEVFYRSHTSNIDLFRATSSTVGEAVVVSDHEKKSIAELRMLGMSVLPAQKGPGSKTLNISRAQNKRLLIHPESTNLIREIQGYKWAKDKLGNFARDGHGRSIPVDGNDHLIDAMLYAINFAYDPTT